MLKGAMIFVMGLATGYAIRDTWDSEELKCGARKVVEKVQEFFAPSKTEESEAKNAQPTA